MLGIVPVAPFPNNHFVGPVQPVIFARPLTGACHPFILSLSCVASTESIHIMAGSGYCILFNQTPVVPLYKKASISVGILVEVGGCGPVGNSDTSPPV